MKKIAIIFVSLALVSCLCVNVCAVGAVTTTPVESTEASTPPVGYEDGMVREADITAPITVCILAVCAITACGIIRLKKAEKDDFKL